MSASLLYLSSTDTPAVTGTIHRYLRTAEYEIYDPFTTITSTAYHETIRLFVAPPHDGWIRILGTPTTELVMVLSHLGLCIWLADPVACYRDGEALDPLDALAPYQRPGCDLRQILSADYTTGAEAVPVSVLPDAYQDMAQKLNPRHVNRLFNKIMKRMSAGGDSDAARDLLAGDQAAARKVAAVLDGLDLPRLPVDFVTLRDAYQVQLRRQRNPQARLYPGDAEAMNAVSDALDYTPIYGGKTS
jgi:hypothetical protein